MSVAGGKVQRCVISPVHDVDARPSHNKHVHHVGAALPAGPVEGAEAVVIATEQQSQQQQQKKHLAPRTRQDNKTHRNISQQTTDFIQTKVWKEWHQLL